MTRPQIIRADTIDLQSPDSPSAKDHTRQPTHPVPLGDGPPAPHQAIALKHAEQEVEFHTRSPRMSQDLSNKELQLLHEDSDSFDSTSAAGPAHDLHSLQRNGISNGPVRDDADIGDLEGDDGSDDDMMDKISSSPSIEDGGSSLTLPWPDRGDSILSPLTPIEDAAPPPPRHTMLSSSPLLSPPTRFSPSYPQKEVASDPLKDHHHGGEYRTDRQDSGLNEDESTTRSHHYIKPLAFERDVSEFQVDFNNTIETYESDFDLRDINHLLLPADDPLLDNSFDDASLSSAAWDEDEKLDGQHNVKNNETGTDSDDDTEEFSYSDDSRFVDSGWGGECLREIEDIDFEFVYALHTFVATVEGQANATKGDTMVLLDDTNSYWWLVRVVKDESIGYLPAEHIETPTERLARLNKHRNVDLSQSMLGDNPEKSRNPLKIAMRRRNAKTVQFAAPTYCDPPPMDYSTDEGEDEEEEREEEDGEREYTTQEEENSDHQGGDRQEDQNEKPSIEPAVAKGDVAETNEVAESKTSLDSRDSDDLKKAAGTERTSEEAVERSDDGTAGRSRKGTLRNTDSFFKDDNLETRKINLTPSLLRDDSSGSNIKSTETKDLKTRGSIDSLEKPQTSPEKGKEDKKRRERKGMLGGLFKRKDKRSKSQEDDVEDGKKSSEELLRESPQPKESLESLSRETQGNKQTPQQQPQRQTSKLQKAPPTKTSLAGKLQQPPRIEQTIQSAPPQEPQSGSLSQPDRAPPGLSENDRIVPKTLSGPVQPSNDNSSIQQVNSNDLPEGTRDLESRDGPRSVTSPTRDVLLLPSEPKPERLKTVNHRLPMDEFDSSPEPEEPPNILPKSEVRDPSAGTNEGTTERLSESPVEVSQPDTLQKQQPPPLVVDTSSQEDPSNSPLSPVSSPELIEAPRDSDEREETPASTAQSSTNTPTWSDANLRAYLEDDSDIRDLLVVVHDKSDVKPANPDHPVVKNLFKEENRRLGEISNQLDGLLGDWLARKPRNTRNQLSK